MSKPDKGLYNKFCELKELGIKGPLIREKLGLSLKDYKKFYNKYQYNTNSNKLETMWENIVKLVLKINVTEGEERLRYEKQLEDLKIKYATSLR